METLYELFDKLLEKEQDIITYDKLYILIKKWHKSDKFENYIEEEGKEYELFSAGFPELQKFFIYFKKYKKYTKLECELRFRLLFSDDVYDFEMM